MPELFMDANTDGYVQAAENRHFLDENPAFVRVHTEAYENAIDPHDEELEFSYRVPTDGTVLQVAPPLPGGAKTVEVENGTNQTLTITDDTGNQYPFASGTGVGRLMSSHQYSLKLAGAASNLSAICLVIFHARRMAPSGVSSAAGGGGGGGGPVTAPLGNQTLAASVAVTAADGTFPTIGALADLATANSLVGLLKAIKAAVQGTITIAFAAAQAVTQSGTWTIQPGNTANTTPWLVTQAPNLTNGVTNFRLNSASAATGVVKNSAGSFLGYGTLINTNAAIRYLHLYNKATAPTLGTDTPVVTIPLPAGAGANLSIDDGDLFGTGIAYAVTTDNIAVPATTGAAGDVQGTLYYT